MIELLGILGVEKLTTSSYRPQTNGRVERFHRYLGSALAIECKRADQSDWDEALPAILFAYRISDCEAIGISPFEAVFGYQPALPTDLLYGNPGNLARYDEANHFDLPLRWRQVHDRVEAHRAEYDRKRHAALAAKRHAVNFEIGEVVGLQVPPYLLEDPEEATEERGEEEKSDFSRSDLKPRKNRPRIRRLATKLMDHIESKGKSALTSMR